MTSKIRLSGKRVLVTAVGQGIGLASAIAMAGKGAHVFATDVNLEALTQLKAKGVSNIETYHLDVLSMSGVF